MVAYGVITAIRERGLRIPEDIALVGFDDVSLSRYVDPALTTVHLPTEAMAHKAYELLVQMINEKKTCRDKVMLDTHLVIRNSCGAWLKETKHSPA